MLQAVAVQLLILTSHQGRVLLKNKSFCTPLKVTPYDTGEPVVMVDKIKRSLVTLLLFINPALKCIKARSLAY